MLRPIIVLSSWSSGSSAVTGFIGECGAYLAPPFAVAMDDKTPSTFESEDFRQMLLATVNEMTLEYKADTKIFTTAFDSWLREIFKLALKNGHTSVALKHPLSAFVLKEICQVCDPIFVVVTRPFAQIENTRMRRQWNRVYGEWGARFVYNRIYNFLHENQKSYMTIPYSLFMESEQTRLKVLDYCDLNVSNSQALQAFEHIMKRPSGK